MKRKTSLFILIIFVLSSQISFAAFKAVDPTAFESFHSIKQFFRKVERCTWHISCYFKSNLGAFATVASTDTLNNFPTTYNNNLNKTVEVGTTSVNSITTLSNLSSIGTITTGTWNASTTATLYGGTGSTSLSQNQILLGNLSGGIKVVNGYGTNGQFLTSGGAGTVPSWTTSAFDTGGNYNLTGIWNHTTASSSFNQNLYLTGSTTIRAASSTAPLILNDVPLSFSSQFPTMASGTVPTLNGNGYINYMHPNWELLGEAITTGATTSVVGWDGSNLNAPTTTREFMIDIFVPSLSSDGRLGLRFNNDGNTTYSSRVFSPTTEAGAASANKIDSYTSSFALFGDLAGDGGGTTSPSTFQITIPNNTASTKKLAHWLGEVTPNSGVNNGNTLPLTITGAGAWNNTTARIFQIALITCAGATTGADYCTASASITLGVGTRITVYGSRP